VRFSELDGARVGVWGAGREVASFARQLARRLPSARIAVAAFDVQPSAAALDLLNAPGAQPVSGAQIVPALRGCDAVVRSPGVSIHRAELRALRDAGVPVTTATALWLAEHGGAGVIGVTGTKGKSTTAVLAFELARAAGVSAALAGNIGVPALDLLDAEPAQITVVELSSYQIADLRQGPQVALVTNLFREHTDWHGSEDAYRADKLRLLALPGVRVAVLNAREARAPVVGAGVEVARFGDDHGWDATPTGVSFAGREVATRGQLPLRGQHNALNLCAALTALAALDVHPPPLQRALRDVRALAHRLETVLDRDGVLWVNDSISTTPESAVAALASFPERHVVLVGGGQDRGQDYAELGRRLARAGATVIGVPTTGPRLLAAATAAGVPSQRALPASDLRDAVALARDVAREGAVVLLSPAAPSYDHYDDFEQRGELFRALAATPSPPADGSDGDTSPG
jgi:UDP-N-acetylmuramoylalanine--D-glutamate ligase